MSVRMQTLDKSNLCVNIRIPNGQGSLKKSKPSGNSILNHYNLSKAQEIEFKFTYNRLLDSALLFTK